MPGFITHHLFGQKTYQQLKNPKIKHLIHKYPKVFALGLQGPDIFFYDLSFLIFRKKSPGTLLHTTETGKFLNQLLQSSLRFSTQKKQQIAKVYVLGFIGHYLLDCTCHPYIYARTQSANFSKSNIGNHMQLETDIDADLLWLFQHKLPSEFSKSHMIQTTLEEKRIISLVLYHAILQTYKKSAISQQKILQAIYGIEKGCRFLSNPNGYKKTLIRKIERYYPGYPLLSSIVPDDIRVSYSDSCNQKHTLWKNPWKTSLESNESFLELFESAKQKYLLLLNEIENSLLPQFGNKNYHSGLTSAPYLF